MTDYPPVRISWSQLRAHNECKQKAYLRRSGKKNPSSDIRVFFPGTVVDRVMRDWLADEGREPGQMARNVAMVMDREEKQAVEDEDGIVRWRNKSDHDQVLQDCTFCVTRLEPLLNQHVVPYEFEPAKWFTVPLTVPGPDGSPVKAVLVGEMDILVRMAGTDWAIYDLKMTKNTSYWRKTIMQLAFYDLAVRAGFGSYAKKMALLQPMCEQQIVPLEVTEDLRNQLVARIIAFVSDVLLGNIEPKKSMSGCTWCDVKYACEKFRPINGRMHLLPD